MFPTLHHMIYTQETKFRPRLLPINKLGTTNTCLPFSWERTLWCPGSSYCQGSMLSVVTSAWPFQHLPGLLAECLDFLILLLNHTLQETQIGLGKANVAVSLSLSLSRSLFFPFGNHHSNLVFIQMSFGIKLGPSQTTTFLKDFFWCPVCSTNFRAVAKELGTFAKAICLHGSHALHPEKHFLIFLRKTIFVPLEGGSKEGIFFFIRRQEIWNLYHSRPYYLEWLLHVGQFTCMIF